ncbi:MAG: diaminopropionate ammonia-lyase [Thiotrichales bacterium]|jgi:diaminopropionate ammonia-lyase|nr:diaminopropionate ammonia-lyase [Thiotrichales bacterium]MBT5984221.1 diaminopropionate ammonia-lyase [Thiotrichales bacterium]MBT7149344.1 diaminopropionate ammonia-lyase [Thiotrichales bacterium]MBT7933043.1 diaminopropionate ammonia-lyase [Thiotrichales bacterium]
MANRYSEFSLSFSHFVNPKVQLGSEYKYQDILSLEGFELASKEITSWDNYKPTPLHSFDDIAQETGVSSVFYKDENTRFNLKSFKALGGAYAVANLLIKKLKDEGIKANSSDLILGTYKDYTSKLTVCCATDGNHGRSVAWGAQQFGCNCEIYIHQNVSPGREKAIAKYGALVNRIDGNYDESVRIAAEVAELNGYTVVSDTSYEGYTDIPKDVMQGYTVMVDEAMKQMNVTPTHVFLQGGVGGFPSAVVSFLQESLDCPPIFVVVEPVNADCLFQSAVNGEPTPIHGDLDTIMAGLACGEVSVLAWSILESHVTHFMSITDESVPKAMQLLANRKTPIVAGESAITGLAGYLIACNDSDLKSKLMINENSKVLFFGTEGDTDEEMYEQLVGRSSEQVLNSL